MCEEFNCLPKAAIEAIEEDEGFLLIKILEFRAYARAKEVYDTTKMENRPKGGLIDKVSEITMHLAHERMIRLRAQEDDSSS